MPCGVGQTPQIRCVICWASSGSRPLRIVSKPRNNSPSQYASETRDSFLPLPFAAVSVLAWTAKCPSMRVKGLIEIVFFIVELTCFLPNNIAVPVHGEHLGIALGKTFLAYACCFEQVYRRTILLLGRVGQQEQPMCGKHALRWRWQTRPIEYRSHFENKL